MGGGSITPKTVLAGQSVELSALQAAVGEAQVRIVAQANHALGFLTHRHRRQQRGGDPVHVADQPECEQRTRLVGHGAVPLGATYGPLAGTIGLLLWTFLTSVALFLGLAFSAQLEAVRAGVPGPRVES
jgi:hypothetical protein